MQLCLIVGLLGLYGADDQTSKELEAFLNILGSFKITPMGKITFIFAASKLEGEKVKKKWGKYRFFRDSPVNLDEFTEDQFEEYFFEYEAKNFNKKTCLINPNFGFLNLNKS